jgi:hypothetical protein
MPPFSRMESLTIWGLTVLGGVFVSLHFQTAEELPRQRKSIPVPAERHDVSIRNTSTNLLFSKAQLNSFAHNP